MSATPNASLSEADIFLTGLKAGIQNTQQALDQIEIQMRHMSSKVTGPGRGILVKQAEPASGHLHLQTETAGASSIHLASAISGKGKSGSHMPCLSLKKT